VVLGHLRLEILEGVDQHGGTRQQHLLRVRVRVRVRARVRVRVRLGLG
jgi:hypothetical protein